MFFQKIYKNVNALHAGAVEPSTLSLLEQTSVQEA
jgi:hypothetical protein